MGAPFTPSRYILRKAMQLGQKMALKDRRIRPDLAQAYQYPSFDLFRTVYRHHLESLDALAPWDDKLQRLIEREANGARVDMSSQRVWDAFYQNVAMPIRSSFWYGWEQVWQLEGRYSAAVEEFQKRNRKRPVLHVYHPEPPAGPVAAKQGVSSEEQAHWDRVAEKLFDEMHADGDEAFWDLPGAELPFAVDKRSKP